MKKLSGRKLTKRKIIIAVLAILLIIPGIIFSIKIFNDQQTESWIKSTQDKIYSYSSQLNNDSNVEDTEKVLLALQNDLEQTPKPSYIIFNFNKDRYESFSNNLDSLIKQIKLINSTIIYQKELSTIVSALSNSSSNNLEELQTAQKTWSDSISSISSIQPPESLQELNSNIYQQLKSISDDVSQLVELFKQEDRSGFLSKQDAMNEKIANLHNIGAQFKEYLKAQDLSLNNSLKSIAEFR